MKRIIANIFFAAALVMIQLSFVNGLPFFLSSLNVVLTAAIFVLVLAGLETALWWPAAAGVLLDAFSFSPFGLHTASLAITIILASLLLDNFFTNRSLYSFLALSAASLLVYELAVNFFGFLAHYFGADRFPLVYNRLFWEVKLWQSLSNLIFVAVVFYIFNFVSDKLKPVFLARK